MRHSYPWLGLLTSVLFFLSRASLQAQSPANDEPCGAVVLTPSGPFCAAPVVGTTQGATVTVPTGYTNTGSCAGVATGSARDVWYTFTTTATGLGSTGATLTVAGNAAGLVRLFSAPSCSGPFTELACQAAQANTSAPALTTTALTATTTYYVRVAGSSAATAAGPFSICLTDGPGAPPACQAAALGAPVFTNAGNTAASFSFTPLASNAGPYTCTLLSGPTGSTVVQSFAITAPGFTISGLVPGTNYSLRVTGYCTAGGQFQLARPLVVLPPNDDPCGAQALVLSPAAACIPVRGTTRATTTAPNGYANPGCGGAAQPTDVWYTFTTTASGAGSTEATLTVSDVEGASQLRLFAAASCAGPFTELACTTGSTGAAPLTATGLVPNTTYYVSVAPAQFRIGTFFTLCASAAPPVFPCLTPTLSIPPPTITATSAHVVFTVPAGSSPAPPAYTLTYTPQSGGPTRTVTPPYGPVLAPNQPVYQAGTPLTGLTPGTTYGVTVQTTCAGGGQSAVATATFTTQPATVPQPPANDECTGATLLPVTTSCTPLSTTNFNALAVGLSAGSSTCGYYLGADVWYQLVVPPNGIVQVTTGPVAGSVVEDTGLSLYTGTCGTLTEVACNDDRSPTNLFSQARATGLLPGSIVYAQVWRTGSLVGGPFTICATTDVTCPVVRNLAATSVTQTAATISFTVPAGSSGDTLRYSAAGGPTQTQPVTSSPVTLTGLMPGTAYTVTLTTTCVGSLPSTVALPFTTLAVPTCAAPGAVYASNVTTTSAGIGFVLHANASGYTVTYQAAGGPVQTVSPVPTASPVTLTGLVPGTRYTVCVASTCLNGLASSPRCAPDFTTTGTAPTCAAPTAVVAASTGPTTARVSFTPAAGVPSYTVTYTAAGGTAQTLTPNPTASPVALTGLLPGVAYTVTVASNCAGGTTSLPALVTLATPLASRASAQAELLRVFPNPAHHSVTLTVPATLLRHSSLLTLSDAMGRTVRQQVISPPAGPATATHLEVNLTGLAPGVYHVRLLSSAGPLTKRLLIE